MYRDASERGTKPAARTPVHWSDLPFFPGLHLALPGQVGGWVWAAPEVLRLFPKREEENTTKFPMCDMTWCFTNSDTQLLKMAWQELCQLRSWPNDRYTVPAQQSMGNGSSLTKHSNKGQFSIQNQTFRLHVTQTLSPALYLAQPASP